MMRWAAYIMEDIKFIMLSLSKIFDIEKHVNKINPKVETLEIKVRGMDSKVPKVEKSNKFINKEFEETRI